jgi:hypothetical protein
VHIQFGGFGVVDRFISLLSLVTWDKFGFGRLVGLLALTRLLIRQTGYALTLGASRGHPRKIGLKMKIKESTLVLTTLLLLTNCGSELYSKKELRTQTIPTGLQNKTWTLRKINSENILDVPTTTEFNNSNGTENCQFTFQFADKGELIMSFKEYKFKGVYLVTGDKFKFLYDGFREKIVWTTNPECKITPTELGYVFNTWGEVEFKIENQQLTLKNKQGDSFLLTANI